ncbi:45272_t:CDS:2, partial [Gigaspora margarita]
QSIRSKFVLKDKKKITGKEKAKENYYTKLGSKKPEGRHKSALIASKGAPVVLTNNSALGKDLASHSTNLNRCQNYRGLVAQGDIDTFSTLKFEVYNINSFKNNVQKLQEVCDYSKTQKLNIIGLVKMNISIKEAKFIKIEYKLL